MPNTSLIVPIYNVEPFLNRCIDSILSQTNTNLEVLLVDDGSNDDCGAICERYAELYANIYVIHQKNGGLSAARNIGIDLTILCSDSEWIGFLDSDDWIHPQYIELLLQALNDGNHKVSICDYKSTRTLDAIDYRFPFRCYTMDGLDFYTSDRGAVTVIACGKLFHKSLFSDVRFPVGKLHEDEFVTFRLFSKAGTVAYVDAQLYYYFQNDHGITRGPFSNRQLDLFEALGEQEEFFRQLHNEEYYKRWLHRALFYHYPLWIKKLEDLGYRRERRKLIRDGRKLYWKNRSRVKSLRDYNRGFVTETYFPLVNQIKMPLLHFASITKEKGLGSAIKYYGSKISALFHRKGR